MTTTDTTTRPFPVAPISFAARGVPQPRRRGCSQEKRRKPQGPENGDKPFHPIIEDKRKRPYDETKDVQMGSGSSLSDSLSSNISTAEGNEGVPAKKIRFIDPKNNQKIILTNQPKPVSTVVCQNPMTAAVAPQKSVQTDKGVVTAAHKLKGWKIPRKNSETQVGKEKQPSPTTSKRVVAVGTKPTEKTAPLPKARPPPRRNSCRKTQSKQCPPQAPQRSSDKRVESRKEESTEESPSKEHPTKMLSPVKLRANSPPGTEDDITSLWRSDSRKISCSYRELSKATREDLADEVVRLNACLSYWLPQTHIKMSVEEGCWDVQKSISFQQMEKASKEVLADEILRLSTQNQLLLGAKASAERESALETERERLIAENERLRASTAELRKSNEDLKEKWEDMKFTLEKQTDDLVRLKELQEPATGSR